MSFFFISALVVAWIMSGAVACTKKQTVDPAQMTPQQLVERGQAIYRLNCISCHNADPKLDGTIGPAVAQSSLELVQLRIMKAQYPAGYSPKRSTSQMPAMPHLEKEILAIHAFLNSENVGSIEGSTGEKK